LAFTDTTSGDPVAAPVTLNTATAASALLPQVTTSTGVNSLPVWTELDDLNSDGILDLLLRYSARIQSKYSWVTATALLEQ
jgi:hypothetical protein